MYESIALDRIVRSGWGQWHSGCHLLDLCVEVEWRCRGIRGATLRRRWRQRRVKIVAAIIKDGIVRVDVARGPHCEALAVVR